jgi:cell division protein FtsZ
MDFERLRSSIIKVVGIGGGGCNAVNHMHSQGIQGVDFVVCNTDGQSLEASPVMNKIQLGAGLTDGLGAGNDPSAGKNAALESIDDIREMFENNTKMIFVTAGMGGGTGTGAAPVIAQVAREMGILTVGIVTIPFSFEGRKRKIQAQDGIAELRQHVDSLIIICNDKLRQLFGNLKLSDAFARADNVLTTAAKGIAEIITVTGYVNVDFEDVKTVMKDSGVAIMGIGISEGENRALKAAEMALNSPLLNDNNIKGAKNILLYISSGSDEIAMDELADITDYIQDEAGLETNIIWGNSTDESLGNKISVILVAAGFDSTANDIYTGNDSASEKPQKKHILDTTLDELQDNAIVDPLLNFEIQKKESAEDSVFVSKTQESMIPSKKYDLFEDNLPQQSNDLNESENVFELSVSNREESKQDKLDFELKKIDNPVQEKGFLSENGNNPPALKTQQDRINKLKDLSMKIRTGEGLEEIENQPAFVRRGIDLPQTTPSNQSDISDSSVTLTSSGVQINKGNSFLHDNVD